MPKSSLSDRVRNDTIFEALVALTGRDITEDTRRDQTILYLIDTLKPAQSVIDHLLEVCLDRLDDKTGTYWLAIHPLSYLVRRLAARVDAEDLRQRVLDFYVLSGLDRDADALAGELGAPLTDDQLTQIAVANANDAH